MQPRASGEAGLYLHLPFCSRKCGYCDFYSTTATEAQRDRYGRALLRELGRRLGQQDCRDTLFSSLYLGGALQASCRMSFLMSSLHSRGLWPDAFVTDVKSPSK